MDYDLALKQLSEVRNTVGEARIVVERIRPQLARGAAARVLVDANTALASAEMKLSQARAAIALEQGRKIRDQADQAK